jgi:CheY-like chemotaxis protein
VSESDSATGPLLAGVKVLCVDDTADSREVMMVMLRTQGATVLGAESVDEALALVQSERPDVVLSDIAMPGNGHSLIQQIRALPEDAGGQTPAAAVTAFTSPDDQARALAAGFQVHIPKPVDMTQVTMAVAAIVGRSPGSPAS